LSLRGGGEAAAYAGSGWGNAVCTGVVETPISRQGGPMTCPSHRPAGHYARVSRKCSRRFYPADRMAARLSSVAWNCRKPRWRGAESARLAWRIWALKPMGANRHDRE